MSTKTVNTGIINCCRCSCRMGEAVLSNKGKRISCTMAKENHGPFTMQMRSKGGDMIRIDYEDLCVTCHGVLLNNFSKAGTTLRGQGKRLAKERKQGLNLPVGG